MHRSAQSVVADCAAVLGRVRSETPRVQCLTNTVAQQITANVLLASGARVSMASHPDEVTDMAASAQALLINLGTLDTQRIDAIPRLLVDLRVTGLPRVLDPVFVEHSRLRLALARQVIAAGPLIVKGNSRELAALELPVHATRVETGVNDCIGTEPGKRLIITNGHRRMAEVTGLGCALGGLIAACAAVDADPLKAATAAVLAFGVAGDIAGAMSQGPGSFAVNFIDALGQLDGDAITTHARIDLS